MPTKMVVYSRYTSLFPLLINRQAEAPNTKIFVKFWLYNFCLTEWTSVSDKGPQLSCYYGRVNTKRQKHLSQTLRSPNRHKVAQFHTAVRFFETNIITSLPINTTAVPYLYIISFVFDSFLSFESSGMYLKNTSIKTKQLVSFRNLLKL